MTRPIVAALSAFALGLAASGLVACGGTRDGVPADDASALLRELDDVREFVERGECDGLDGQLRQVQQRLDNLPGDVDARLVRDLSDGLDQLRTASLTDCNAGGTPTLPTTIETTTQTAPTTTTATSPPPPTTPTATVSPATTPTAPTPPPSTTPEGGTPIPQPEPEPEPDGGAVAPGSDGGAGVTP